MDCRFLWETLKAEYLGNDLYKWTVKAVFDKKIGTLVFYSDQKTGTMEFESEDWYVHFGMDDVKHIPINNSGFLKIGFIPVNGELFTLKINED